MSATSGGINPSRQQQQSAENQLKALSKDVNVLTAYMLIAEVGSVFSKLIRVLDLRRCQRSLSKSTSSKKLDETTTNELSEVDTPRPEVRDWHFDINNDDDEVQSLARKWVELLESPVVEPNTSTSGPSSSSSSRKSPRLMGQSTAGEGELAAADDSDDNDEQSSQLPCSEDEEFQGSVPTSEGKTSCGFEPSTTMAEALNELHAAIFAEGKAQVVSEREKTQYVVNRIISAALPSLQDIFGEIYNKSNNKSTLGNNYDKCLELAYYQETNHKYSKKLLRLPDSLLYVIGKGASVKLDTEAASVGNLVAFEHKDTLLNENNVRKGLNELERDYAEKMIAEDLLEQALGYGVLTDGIHWRFYRFSTQCSENGEDWHINAEVAKACIRGKGDESYSFESLAKGLHFVVTESLRSPKRDTGFASFAPTDLKFTSDEGTVGSVPSILQFLHFGRRAIAKVMASSNGCKETPMIMKFPLFMSKGGIAGKKNGQKEMEQMMNELHNLNLFKDDKSIVSVAPGFENFSSVIILEDAGVSLNRLICSGEAGILLAKVVFKDIWCGALAALNEQGKCHADIHEGNICVKSGDNRVKATLVDLESAVDFGNALRGTPIKNRNQVSCTKASKCWDQASVCAILDCLWTNERSFDDIETRTEYWLKICVTKPDETPGIVNEIKKEIRKDGAPSFAV